MKKSRFYFLSEEEGGSEEDVGSGSYNVRAMPVRGTIISCVLVFIRVTLTI